MTKVEAIQRLQYLISDTFSFYGTNKISEDVKLDIEAYRITIKALEREPISDKYKYHIDHTDCIWYGTNSGFPVTCSQYRDGWNDAMEYIFKGGKGYQPYRRREE